MKGKTYKEADLYSYIREEPEFAKLFDLDGVEKVMKLRDNPDNPYWSLINKKVMGKFKFEVIGAGEICACSTKDEFHITCQE